MKYEGKNKATKCIRLQFWPKVTKPLTPTWTIATVFISTDRITHCYVQSPQGTSTNGLSDLVWNSDRLLKDLQVQEYCIFCKHCTWVTLAEMSIVSMIRITFKVQSQSCIVLTFGQYDQYTRLKNAFLKWLVLSN